MASCRSFMLAPLLLVSLSGWLSGQQMDHAPLRAYTHCPAATQTVAPHTPAALWARTCGTPEQQPVRLPEQAAGPDFKRFHLDLAQNFKRLFSHENLLPALLGASAAIIVAPKDDETARYFQAATRFPEHGAGDFLGDGGVIAGGIAVLLVTSRITEHQRLRQASYSMAQAFVLNSALTFSLKVASDRERPDRSNERSFPSGHTSNAFAVATILDHYYGHKAGIPAYLAASFVGLSRLEDNRHFLSDVITGATLGYIVGRTVARTGKNGRVTWTPRISRDKQEVSIMIQFHAPE